MFGTRSPTREQVFQRLFGLMSGLQFDVGDGVTPDPRTLVTATRRIALFSDVPDVQQPWGGQAEHNETSSQTSGMPYKRIWPVSWMFYHKAGLQPGVNPTTWNNAILDAVEKALAPLPNDEGFLEERNTLLGLVWHCYIDGEIFKDPGDIDNQALIVVPIKILVP